MSDGPMKAEFSDRIDKLNELIEAEREVQAASSAFESAQWAVVKAAERLQEWAHRWNDCRGRVEAAYPGALTEHQITFYGQGNRLSDANEVMRKFCDDVRLKQEAIAALTPAPVEAEPGIPDALGEFMKREGAVEWVGGPTPLVEGQAAEVLFDDDATEIVDKSTWHRAGEVFTAIKAYRIISEPAAGEGAEIVSGVKLQDADVEFADGDYFPTQPFTIGASKPHADESNAQMFAAGINRELEKA